jgi:hypothetical protein
MDPKRARNGRSNGAAIDASVPTQPPSEMPDTFFDLSFRGALPELLRSVAARLESRDCEAEEFLWSLGKERLEFTVRIAMHPHGSTGG